MRVSFKNNRIAVYDDVLSKNEQEQILQYFDRAKFRQVLPENWGSGYRLSDGRGLVGTQIISSRLSDDDLRPVYPTGTALDGLVDQLLALATEVEPVVGAMGVAWTAFTMAPFIYPSSSSLSWHSDAHCAGAYIYYAHPFWSFNWGGGASNRKR